MAKLGVTSFILDRVLAHKLAGVIRHYNHFDYLAEKKQALQRWDAALREILDA